MNQTPVFSRFAAAAPHAAAAEAGRAILAEGGNAIEAMVAMAAAIAVVYPHMNSIGGDGFWLIGEPGGKVRAIEAGGFAGARATIARYREAEFEAPPARGPWAALTVPGAIGGWALALELSAGLGGRLPLDVLLDGATRLAREGYGVSGAEARVVIKQYEAIKSAPGFAQAFLVEGERPKAGTMRKAPRLADTFGQLARAGLDDFYRGDVARELGADLDAMGSPVTRADLAAYRARWREPLSMRFKDAALYNTAPPTQGLASLILLGQFERLGVKRVGDFDYFHALIESTKRAFAIRDRVCTDFDRLRHDCAALLAPEALDREAARIDRRRAAPWPLAPDEGDTIWMGAIDAEGRAVSYIQSLYWEYGSGCVSGRTGVLMANRGVSFSLDLAAVNPLEPGRRPFTTLNPAIARLDDGRLVAYGSMGGDGQPQFQAQILTRYLFGETVAAALDAPRFVLGRTSGEVATALRLEGGFDDAVGAALAAAGHEVEWIAQRHADAFGHAGMLARGAKGAIEAGHDPRSDGGAAGA